jgi:putative endonuclease
MYFVYILFSESKSKYYTGQTNDLDDRLKRHNSMHMSSTKHGVPWRLIYSAAFETRSEAVLLELKIKKRGAKRYLEDNGISTSTL